LYVRRAAGKLAVTDVRGNRLASGASTKPVS